MLTKEIQDLVDFFYDNDKDGIFPYREGVYRLFSMITQLSGEYRSIVKYIPGVARNDGQSISFVKTDVVGVSAKILQWSPRDFFESIRCLKDGFVAISEIHDGGGPMKDHLVLIDHFCNLYDEFLTRRTHDSAWNLLVAANELNSTVIYSLDLLRSVFREINNQDDFGLSEGWGVMELRFFSSDSFNQVSSRIHAVGRLYSTLCSAMGVSEQDFNLAIGKIETGSLWIKVFGESRVISFMISCVESGAGFLYRNFSREGKISAIPRSVDALNVLIGLREKMGEVGLSDDEIDKNIAASAVSISRELNRLLENQGALKVNERYLSASGNEEVRLLESRPWPRLEHREIADVDVEE